MKSLASSERWSGIGGVSLFRIKLKRWPKSLMSGQGLFAVANSIKRQPKLQISLLVPTGLYLMTSGAIQRILPLMS